MSSTRKFPPVKLYNRDTFYYIFVISDQKTYFEVFQENLVLQHMVSYFREHKIINNYAYRDTIKNLK